MVDNIEEEDLLFFENPQKCKLEDYSGKNIDAEYYVSSVKFKGRYVYLINIKNSS